MDDVTGKKIWVIFSQKLDLVGDAMVNMAKLIGHVNKYTLS